MAETIFCLILAGIGTIIYVQYRAIVNLTTLLNNKNKEVEQLIYYCAESLLKEATKNQHYEVASAARDFIKSKTK